jgi:hypothetical protein
VVSLGRYIDHLVEISREEHLQTIVAEEPMRLITAAACRFSQEGIRLAMNSQDVVKRCFIEVQTSRNCDSTNGYGNRTHNDRPGAIPRA